VSPNDKAAARMTRSRRENDAVLRILRPETATDAKRNVVTPPLQKGPRQLSERARRGDERERGAQDRVGDREEDARDFGEDAEEDEEAGADVAGEAVPAARDRDDAVL